MEENIGNRPRYKSKVDSPLCVYLYLDLCAQGKGGRAVTWGLMIQRRTLMIHTYVRTDFSNVVMGSP